MAYKTSVKGALASFFMLTHLHSAPLTIHSFSKTHHFDVEVVDTNQKRKRGLMGRKKLPLNQGMLFIFSQQEQQCFWMHKTSIPLDLLFVDESGKIVDIVHSMHPYSHKRHCSKKPVRRAIELSGGICHDRGIEIGDTVIVAEGKNNEEAYDENT